ncbi:hypothetical protein B0H13DRAFT_2389277 [Mycena leptocephala]|nr:hypothetical protein B0H13DRAFT_2389277 [Mycena leptocephala]
MVYAGLLFQSAGRQWDINDLMIASNSIECSYIGDRLPNTTAIVSELRKVYKNAVSGNDHNGAERHKARDKHATPASPSFIPSYGQVSVSSTSSATSLNTDRARTCSDRQKTENAARKDGEVGGVKKGKIGPQDCSATQLKARGELIIPNSSSPSIHPPSARPPSSAGALLTSASKEKHHTDYTPSLWSSDTSSANHPSHATSPCPSPTSHWTPLSLALPFALSRPLSSRNTASRTPVLQSDGYHARMGADAPLLGFVRSPHPPARASDACS